MLKPTPRLSTKFFLLLLPLLLACSHEPSPMGKPLPDLSYDYLNPYMVLNGRVDIRQSFKPDLNTKEAVKRFVIAPDQLLKRYADNRFVVTENLPIKMVFDVRRAALIQRFVEKNPIGFLTGQNAEYYTLDIVLGLSEVTADGRLKAPYTISLKRELRLAENLSLSEKEFRQFEFLEHVMTDIDRGVNDILKNKMR
jgi:hypothetical protein